MHDKGERIAKRIAASGVCSRRDAEKLIAEGRVTINGETIHSPARNVLPQDSITIDNIPLAEKPKTRVWLYHKPPGVLTTHKDKAGRPTVFEQLPEDMPRVISVGRLDMNSEGLLLLTNSGELARRLEHPSTGLTRTYRVRVHGKPTEKELAALSRGITIEGFRYDRIQARVERETGHHSWLEIILCEGKNREIRKVMAHLGYQVSRLIRVSYGEIRLGDLPRGHVHEMPKQSVQRLLSCG